MFIRKSKFDQLETQLNDKVETLLGELQEMAGIVDWERLERDVLRSDTSNTGNDYLGYEQATVELANKYDGSGIWGNQIAQLLIDARASTICGAGLSVKVDGEKEKEFVTRFMDFNGLDEENLVQYARDGEIDGKLLLTLVKDEDEQGPVVGLRVIPWSQHKYTVTTDPKDYKTITEVSYQIEGSQGRVKLTNTDEFVFMKLSGRTAKVNNTRSKVAKVIMQMENLDRALNDLRQINRLYATPTPYLETETKDQADQAVAWVAQQKWRIGKFLAGTGKFSMVTADMAGAEVIIKEIVTNVQIISGGTGIPPHFLGFPELMSNRATAENLLEMLSMATNSERRVHIGGWKEVFQKAFEFQSKLDNGTYSAEGLVVDIPYIHSAKLQEVIDVWLPLNESDKISDQTLMSKIPGIDPDEELQRLEDEAEDAMPEDGTSIEEELKRHQEALERGENIEEDDDHVH